MTGSGSSFGGTRPSSDDLSLLLEEPSTPIGHFRPIEAEMLGESFASSTGFDARLQYANPYSRSWEETVGVILAPGHFGDSLHQA